MTRDWPVPAWLPPHPGKASGPFGNGDEVRAAYRWWYDAALDAAPVADPQRMRQTMRAGYLARMTAALRYAQVLDELGDYDTRIVEWVADLDQPTVEVVASLIERAHEAGGRQERPHTARLDVAGVYREYRARWRYTSAEAREAVLQEVTETLEHLDDEGDDR